MRPVTQRLIWVAAELDRKHRYRIYASLTGRLMPFVMFAVMDGNGISASGG
jgi:hypothetical protein